MELVEVRCALVASPLLCALYLFNFSSLSVSVCVCVDACKVSYFRPSNSILTFMLLFGVELSSFFSWSLVIAC